jgi:rhodanese-related sulfurtransferase
VVLMLIAVAFASGVALRSEAADVLRISKDDLRGMLGSPDLVIIDVRTEKEWKKSDKKIVGSTWEDADEFDNWSKKYPNEKTIVLYCS